MNYSIKLFFQSQSLIEVQLEGDTKISELIDFLIENFPQQFKAQDRARILVRQRSSQSQIYLNPQHNLQQILGQKQGDTYDIEINQQSIINEKQTNLVNQPIQGGYPVQQQNNQTQNTQQNSNQQLGYPIQSQIQQYSLTFIYNNDQVSCELDGETTLEEIFNYIEQHFSIQEQVNFICNQVNLSQCHKQSKLHTLQLNQKSQIQIIPAQSFLNQQPDENPNQMVKLQFEIEDGMIKRNCVLNCKTTDQLGQLKLAVLGYIGINSLDIADVDFYFGQTVFGGPKLGKTLAQLQINKDHTTIKAKVRWIGG